MEDKTSIAPRPVEEIQKQAHPLWLQLADITFGVEQAQRRSRMLVGQLEKLKHEAEQRQALDKVSELQKATHGDLDVR